ncbi:MAG: hypothetical protein IJZ88_07855 [Clostridia bacterium]|nr:hypothetical protein [Clostridia bacterium]
MKNYNEVAHSVLLRRDEYDEAQRVKKKKMNRISSFVSCFAVVAVLSVGIWQSGWFDSDLLPTDKPSSQEGGSIESTSNHAKQEKPTNQTTIPSTEQSTLSQSSETSPDGGSFSGGEGNYFNIPLVPFDKEIKITGETITDAEAQEYFRKNKISIMGSLASSGVSSDSIKMSDKGYCHVSYDGTIGKSLEVRQNYRDYLIYNDNKLVAIITLWKENGEIFNTLSFGAKWFDNYNTYLQAHKGEELIYVYAGWLEIIIAPDNTYFNPMGYDVSKYLEGVEKPYDVFYHELNSYMP